VTILYGMGEFPEAVLGLAFSLGFALLLAYGCLKFLLSLLMREQYNVTDAPRHVRSIVWTPDDGTVGRPADRTNGGSVGGQDIHPAAAPSNRFARSISESVDASGGTMVQLSEPVRGRTAEGGRRVSRRRIL
jgi:hypothetical protein